MIKEIAVSDDEIVDYFKNNPHILKEREEELLKRQQEKHIENEERKKKRIKNRMFAYEYEDTVYEIYAPYAKYRANWGICDKFLPKEEILNKISSIRNIPLSEAEELLNKLEQHDVLYKIGDKYMLGIINSIGDWDIVSDTDMNLGKWMVSHGYDNEYNGHTGA